MINSFISGFTAYLRAVQLISRLRLWSYVLVPMLLSLVLGILIFGAAWNISDDIGGWIISWYPWEWGRGVLEKIASVFGGIFVIALGLILFKNLILALASPFMSPLSEKVEYELTGYKRPQANAAGQFVKDLVRGVRIALRNIIRELFYTILLFLLGLIPVFTPFTTILIFLVQSFYMGFGNMDFTLERHFNIQGSVQFVRRHRGLALGNGAAFMLLLLTGIGFLIALPLGTVAATSETIKRLD